MVVTYLRFSSVDDRFARRPSVHIVRPTFCRCAQCIAVDREVHRQLFQLSVGPVSVWDEGDSMPDGLPPHANIVKGPCVHRPFNTTRIHELKRTCTRHVLMPFFQPMTDLVRALEETRRMGKEDSLPSTKAMQLSWAEWFDS